MKISKQAQRDARQLFRNCLVNGLLDDSRVRQTVSLLLAKKPRGYVGILERFLRLMKLEVARHAVKVENAVEIDSAEKQTIQSHLERKYGAGLNFQYLVNPALIGGTRVQVGSDLYDGSVKTRLEKLEQSF
jgi:F-type H+-transporting ATPase subunit delta